MSDNSTSDTGKDASADTPVIGRPSAPPPALVVAVSAGLVSVVRRARRNQFLINGSAVLIGTGIAAGAALLANRYASVGRLVAFCEAAALGLLLVMGVLLHRRPLEMGLGILTPSESGRISPLSALKGMILLVPGAFREAAEGLVYAVGLVKTDPSAELAAWIVLALMPPHGPPQGTWVSLSGLSAAGLFSLPEDLRTSLRALTSRGWVATNRGVYPPQVQLTPEGATFVKDIALGGG